MGTRCRRTTRSRAKAQRGLTIQILLFNKPYNVLSQFTDNDASHSASRQTLADFIPVSAVRAAGRLDRDSEGLLVLTDSGSLQHKLTDPSNKVSKTYWVQVEGTIDDRALTELAEGVCLKDGCTLPARAQAMPEPENLWPRTPPIRTRQRIPTSWLNLTLSEGRNRQVRRMCAAVGFPVLRLIRYRVASWTLDGIEPGHWFRVNGEPPFSHNQV